MVLRRALGIMLNCKEILVATYFGYEGEYYEQTGRVPMGSPLSSVITGLIRPRIYWRYVDDGFLVWQYGIEKLQNYAAALSGIHEQIQFSIEVEQNNQLAFLDILIEKQGDGSLGQFIRNPPIRTVSSMHWVIPVQPSKGPWWSY